MRPTRRNRLDAKTLERRLGRQQAAASTFVADRGAWDRKQQAALRALEISQRNYRIVAEHSADLITLYGVQGEILYESPSWNRFYLRRLNPDRCHGDDLLAEDRPAALAAFRQVAQSGGSAQIECRLIGPDGAPVWMDAVYAGVEASERGGRGVLVTQRNVQMRKTALLRLAEQEQLMRTLADNAQDFIAVFDRKGRLAYANPALRDRVSAAVLDGWNVLERTLPAAGTDAARLGEAFQDVISRGRHATLTHRWVMDAGTEVWVEAAMSPIGTSAGQVGQVLLSARDMTMRLAMESAERRESLAVLTGGFAHDFNNLLGIIVGSVDHVLDELPEGAAGRTHLRRALDAAERGAQITRSLLATSHRQRLSVRAHDLVELMRETQPLLRSCVGADVRLSLETASPPLRVAIDAAGFTNAVLSLLSNAAEALARRQGDKRVWVRLGNVPGAIPRACLEIQDNGLGMPERVRRRVFEPYFTTKGRSSGTGLGLPVVRALVEQLGGSIQIDSVEGEGTTVRLCLPLEDAEPAAVAGEAGQRLLVVEDQRPLRELACDWLADLGYAVESAGSASEARTLLARQPFDVLITDVALTDSLDGVELAREAQRSHPDLKVILSSGYGDALAEARRHENWLVLDKPYRRDDLVACVRRCIAPGERA